MPSLFVRPMLVCILTAFSSLVVYGQSVDKQLEYTIDVFADGVLVEPNKSIPLTTNTLVIKGQLTAKSTQEYPLLEPYVLTKQTYVNIIRNGRRIKLMYWDGDEVPIGVITSMAPLRSGDRCSLEFKEVRTQAKNGVTRKLTGNKSCLITFL